MVVADPQHGSVGNGRRSGMGVRPRCAVFGDEASRIERPLQRRFVHVRQIADLPNEVVGISGAESAGNGVVHLAQIDAADDRLLPTQETAKLSDDGTVALCAAHQRPGIQHDRPPRSRQRSYSFRTRATAFRSAM